MLLRSKKNNSVYENGKATVGYFKISIFFLRRSKRETQNVGFEISVYRVKMNRMIHFKASQFKVYFILFC